GKAEGVLGWDEVVDILKVSIFQPTARGESRSNSGRVLTGQANLARQSRLLGGVRPYGYKAEYQTINLPGQPPKTVPVRLAPDGPKAVVVRWIFDRYAAGGVIHLRPGAMDGPGAVAGGATNTSRHTRRAEFLRIAFTAADLAAA